MAPNQKLYRLPKEGMIAGVASGFARYFSMDVTLMRLIFVGVTLMTGGAAILVYIVLVIIMPTPEKSVKGDDLEDKVENLAQEVKSSSRARDISSYIGVGLIIIGAWLLVGQFFPDLVRIQWSILWPSLVIAMGALIIIRSEKHE